MKGNNNYSFTGFALIKVTTLDDEVYFKVFGSNSGGYLDGDSWRLCSEVKSVKKDENYYYFRSASGSLYKVPIDGGHISAYCSSVLHQGLDKNNGLELVDIDRVESVLEEFGIKVEVV